MGEYIYYKNSYYSDVIKAEVLFKATDAEGAYYIVEDATGRHKRVSQMYIITEEEYQKDIKLQKDKLDEDIKRLINKRKSL